MSDIDLLAEMGTDASKWVDEYMRRFGDEAPDEGTLLGWFANAIEAGRNAGITTEDDIELTDDEQATLDRALDRMENFGITTEDDE